MEKIKSKINHKDIGACGIKNMKNGGILINCETRSSTIRAKQIIEEKLGEKFEVKLPEIRKSRLKIKNIEEKIDEILFVKELRERNENLNDVSIELIKIIEKKSIRNQNVYDAIIEVDSEGFDILMQMKKINFGRKKMWGIRTYLH